MKEDKMGGTCSRHGTDEKGIQYFAWKIMKGRDHAEDISVDGKITLEWILVKQFGRTWTGFV
jgi:hypothetical protein